MQLSNPIIQPSRRLVELLGEANLHIMLAQRRDQQVKVTLHGAIQTVERDVDPMVRHAILPVQYTHM